MQHPLNAITSKVPLKRRTPPSGASLRMPSPQLSTSPRPTQGGKTVEIGVRLDLLRRFRKARNMSRREFDLWQQNDPGDFIERFEYFVEAVKEKEEEEEEEDEGEEEESHDSGDEGNDSDRSKEDDDDSDPSDGSEKDGSDENEDKNDSDTDMPVISSMPLPLSEIRERFGITVGPGTRIFQSRNHGKSRKEDDVQATSLGTSVLTQHAHATSPGTTILPPSKHTTSPRATVLTQPAHAESPGTTIMAQPAHTTSLEATVPTQSTQGIPSLASVPSRRRARGPIPWDPENPSATSTLTHAYNKTQLLDFLEANGRTRATDERKTCAELAVIVQEVQRRNRATAVATAAAAVNNVEENLDTPGPAKTASKDTNGKKRQREDAEDVEEQSSKRQKRGDSVIAGRPRKVPVSKSTSRSHGI